MDHNETVTAKAKVFSSRIAGNLTLIGSLLVILFFVQSLKTGETSEKLDYVNDKKFTLTHPISSEHCLQVVEQGEVRNVNNSSSSYQEVTITHTVKFVCKPSLQWDELRSKIKYSLK